MPEIYNRTRENFPAVVLTLLSIIQAVALQSLWLQMRAHASAPQLDLMSLLGWLQIAISLHVIILLWLIYADLLMRYRITPTLFDSILPFYLGLVEFLLIEVALPNTLGEWVVVYAILSVSLVFLNHKIMSRARSEPDNQAIFAVIPRASRRDWISRGLFFLFFFTAGIWLLITRHNSWIALVVLVVICLRLSFSFRLVAKYWRLTVKKA